LTVDEYREVEDVDEPGDWKTQWLRYATRLPGVAAPPNEGTSTEFDDWIDDVVAAFSKSNGMLEQFRTYWKEEA
jgi:esterase/lipase